MFNIKFNKKTHLLVIITYVLLVFWLSFAPHNDLNLPTLFEGADKIVHFCFYFGMSFLVSSYIDRFTSKRIYSVLSTFFIVALTGGTVEIIQPIFERSLDIFDMIANTLGNISGLGIYLILRKYIIKLKLY